MLYSQASPSPSKAVVSVRCRFKNRCRFVIRVVDRGRYAYLDIGSIYSHSVTTNSANSVPPLCVPADACAGRLLSCPKWTHDFFRGRKLERENTVMLFLSEGSAGRLWECALFLFALCMWAFRAETCRVHRALGASPRGVFKIFLHPQYRRFRIAITGHPFLFLPVG